MPSSRSKQKVPFGASDVANLAKSNPYLARLIEDAKLRNNLRTAADSSKRLYQRVADGKITPKSLLDDKKVQAEVRRTVESVRAVAEAMSEAPKRKAKKARKAGRALVIAGVGGAAAMVGSEKLRSKVLDVLFGAEEEFEYTPPAPSTPPATTTPASTPSTETPSTSTETPSTGSDADATRVGAAAPKSGSGAGGSASGSSS